MLIAFIVGCIFAFAAGGFTDNPLWGIPAGVIGMLLAAAIMDRASR